jgi:hypothetical protein
VPSKESAQRVRLGFPLDELHHGGRVEIQDHRSSERSAPSAALASTP